MSATKPFVIDKWLVYDAFKAVKANAGSAGVDRQSLADFEADLKGNLYKVWNRMSSGSYFPDPVRLPAREIGAGRCGGNARAVLEIRLGSRV
ncbi:hypothetical protein [Cupriavidus necator]